MHNASLPTLLQRLRRQAMRLTPELSRLGGAVGDTLDAAASAANDTAHSVRRRVRRPRTARRRRRGALALLLIGGIGVAIAVLARAEANGESDVLRDDTTRSDTTRSDTTPSDGPTPDGSADADTFGGTAPGTSTESGDRTAPAVSVA